MQTIYPSSKSGDRATRFPNLLNIVTVKTEDRREPNFLGHAAIAGSLIAASFLGYQTQRTVATERMAQWLSATESQPVLTISTDLTAPEGRLNGDYPQRVKLSQDLAAQITELELQLIQVRSQPATPDNPSVPEDIMALEQQLTDLNAQKAAIDQQLGRPSSTAIEQKVLTDQQEYIESRVGQLAAMTSFFYGRYHAAVALAAVSTLVAGISVFAVSKKGWDRVNPVFANILVTASASAIFYGNLPGIFMYEEGFNTSWKLYQEHVTLNQQMSSFIATGGVIGQDPEKPNEYSAIDTNRFIHYVDRRLSTLNQQPVGFNRSGIANLSSFDSALSFPNRPN
jgi:hypothetical protein